ncbi:hypothetical protein D3C71_1553160 [compost metagenome]
MNSDVAGCSVLQIILRWNGTKNLELKVHRSKMMEKELNALFLKIRSPNVATLALPEVSKRLEESNFPMKILFQVKNRIIRMKHYLPRQRLCMIGNRDS